MCAQSLSPFSKQRIRTSNKLLPVLGVLLARELREGPVTPTPKEGSETQIDSRSNSRSGSQGPLYY